MVKTLILALEMVVVKYLLAAILILRGCAAVPRWTENPQNCNPNMWGPEYNHDVWNYAKASGRIFTKAMPYICVENPEVVRMPSYIELLEIPPAKEMPVVAVYQFTDKTGQRKARPGIADFSTAVTQGGVEMVRSVEIGQFYATVKKCSVPSTLEEESCKMMLGKMLN